MRSPDRHTSDAASILPTMSAPPTEAEVREAFARYFDALQSGPTAEDMVARA